jgi:ribose 5-phosphate isomerase B
MRITLGNDHCGLGIKDHVKEVLDRMGVEVVDVGTHTADPVDFPDITRLVCDPVRNGEADRGVLLCGTGVGACIAANKIPGIRAALCHDTFCAHQCVEHDDVNVLAMGAWIIGPITAEEVLRTYLNATFSTEEHFRRRVAKLHRMELDGALELAPQATAEQAARRSDAV